MTHVRRHQRITRGRAVAVRAHERNVPPPPRGADTVWDDGTWEDRGGYYDDEGYWIDTTPEAPDSPALELTPRSDPVREQMREWRARGEPPPLDPEPMTPQMTKLMGCDTPEGRARYERGRAYREAGYTGPLDRDGRIPDPDDPANDRWLGAALSLHDTDPDDQS